MSKEEEEMTKLKRRQVGITCMLNTEVSAVLALLRRNSDPCNPEDGYYDISIQQSLKSLRSLIFNPQQEWRNVDPSIYLSPFLDVIQSEEVPALATGVALSSILKFLKLQIFDEKTPGAKEAMNNLVSATTGCRLEKSDIAFEEAVFAKILQVVEAIMSHPASVLLSDDSVCTIVNTCFHVIQQAQSRGELLQRNGKYTMCEIIQVVYSRLPDIEGKDGEDEESEDGDFDDENGTDSGYGVRCAGDIFHFLCSLLNVVELVETDGMTSQKNDEDVQVFALVLINSALELSGDVIGKHPKLLRMVQDDLFHHLIHYGSRTSPLVLSFICSTVLNTYHFLRRSVRLQLEAFFSYVLFKVAAHGNSIQHQEVALEGIINFCRQPTFLIETYMNYDCAFTCWNVLEEMGKLLCKLAFPTGTPLTSLQVQAFEGLMLIIHTMADNVDKEGNNESFGQYPVEITEYSAFWEETANNKEELEVWIETLRVKKAQKRKILIAGNHFNQDEKKGLEYLKISNLVSDPPDPKAFAYFFRFTPKLDKNMIGDYLGDPDEFHIQVLKEFTSTLAFTGMNLDSALRIYLETFRLPGESQKIQRILEAFSDRFYDQQSSDLFESKDAVLILCYSLIMLNTDQHNPQVKKKMTEEEFIRNNRAINGGKDLPREYLSELFHSIANNAFTLSGQAGLPTEMNPRRWIELINRTKLIEPFMLCKFNRRIGRDMFATIAGPSVAALSAIFEQADEDDILNECIEGLISIARIAQYGLEDILDELIASFCKFTTLLNPYASTEETLYIFANDLKPRMATLAVFTVANKFGEAIRGAWRNIVDCLLKLKRLKLLPQSVVDPDAAFADTQSLSKSESASTNSGSDSKLGSRSQNSTMIGRFSHFLTMESCEDSLVLGGSEFEQNLKVIQQCRIGNIFTNSSNLHEESLLNLGRSLIFSAAGKGQKFSTAIEEEETVSFCWDLIVIIGLTNLYRFPTFWPAYHEYMHAVAQFPLFSPVPFAEKGILVLFKLCLKILSSYQSDKYPEELIFKSINLMWMYDKEILDTCCDFIMQSVGKIINEYPANVQTQLGWKLLLHLLSVTGRHPESYDQGVETIINLLSDGTHVSRTNYAYCIDCAFGFVARKNSQVDKNIKVLDLMANSVNLLVQWYKNFSDPGSGMSNVSIASTSSVEENNVKLGNFTINLFVKLGEALRKTSLARREEVRNQAVAAVGKSFMLAEELDFKATNFISCFNLVIFAMVDDLHEKILEYSRRENAEREVRSMEVTLKNAMEVLTDVFLQYLKIISANPAFRTFWLGILRRMDTCMKADWGEYGESKLHEVVPDLLKKIIAAMKETEILVPKEDDDLWEITYIQIQWIAPSLKGELFPDVDM
ncbi:Nucleolar GTP-binding protein 2 [Ancistrocladus abbreviatus]